MDSSNLGNPNAYPGGSGGSDSDGQGGGGLPQDEERCATEIYATLEDVEKHDYYKRSSSLPSVGAAIRVEHRKRIVAVDQSGTAIGSLPIAYNYLAECLKEGFEYTGTITASHKSHGKPVVVQFTARPK